MVCSRLVFLAALATSVHHAACFTRAAPGFTHSAAFASISRSTRGSSGVAWMARSRPPPEFVVISDDDDVDVDVSQDGDGSSPTESTDDDWSTPPPDFIVVNDDDDANDGQEEKTDNRSGNKSRLDGADTTNSMNAPHKAWNAPAPRSTSNVDQKKPPMRARPMRPSRKRRQAGNMAGTSWMQKNSKFAVPGSPQSQQQEQQQQNVGKNTATRTTASDDQKRSDTNGNENGDDNSGANDNRPRRASDSFAAGNIDTFRTTRVFVQGIPDDASWQDLKDHFRDSIENSQVVFASVSVDPQTGQSKGHGIVQFETPDMAQTAIRLMRQYPLKGSKLYVREDVQEASSGPSSYGKRFEFDNVDSEDDDRYGSFRRNRPPQKWKCADEENASYLSQDEATAIESHIKARDDARRRKKFEISDKIREDLKEEFGVFLDDRLKLWWTSTDGGRSVPQSIHDVKGEGRWGTRNAEWRQIPTTPENDACVDPDLVEGLLKQRDIARREKDFSTADRLLEQARTAPDGDLALRIHDESRTWRIWTDAPPPRSARSRGDGDEYSRTGRDGDEYSRTGRDGGGDGGGRSDPQSSMETAAQQCINIVKTHEPDKVGEMQMVLSKFPGREYQILKRVKKQYLQQE